MTPHSKYDTWFKIAKELGFVWYCPNEEIKFSESGKMLLDKEKPENELMVFANAFAKYQRHNPFRRVLNKNVPLILLMQTIKLLNNDSEYNGTGISRLEIPLLLCWQNDNAENLYREIKKLRKKYGYSPSNEVILELCYSLLNEKR
ncbi:MAG: AlwI family type II restriction endonuclease [Nitrospirae bacterium]|nr:AlwI family type II restriction endonuclease [Nitrospirota bacterium]